MSSRAYYLHATCSLERRGDVYVERVDFGRGIVRDSGEVFRPARAGETPDVMLLDTERRAATALVRVRP